MASFVKAADAVAAALEIERRGYAFYRRVQEKATEQEAKDFFNFMAEEEQRHEGIFAEMLKRIGGLELPVGVTDEEYLSYVQGLLDSHALFLPGHEDEMMAHPLRGAVRFEKDTLLFFIELEPLVPEAERASVHRCADEERKHIRMLQHFRNSMSRANMKSTL
ncbi:MAG: ferritin family protein [Proteobacteria bacterium]|nr:ferritin family protein [Pseudomonadota bacterium]